MDLSIPYPADVIGVLQDVLKTQTGSGGRKSCVNVSIRDVEGNVIELVLWEDYGKQFINYTTPNNFAGPTIIVLTHAWCKPNTVSGLPCLSNAWSGSKLYINMEHPQVDEFKASFGANLPAPSQSLTANSSDCFATTIGTTTGFNPSKFGWYFESSGNNDAERVTKFKLEVEVEYDNHKGIFVFWDKDCIPFTKLTAQEIREIMKKGANAAVMDVEIASPALIPNQLTQTCEPSIVAEPDSTATHTGSPSASCNSTPAKRDIMSTSINDVIQFEELTPKQPATKGTKGKKTKQLKKD
ncbi:uncharacterized protein LOC131622767 [Vicia villosa]|uniref:uncharacterized protein LOC131622767 n=1 Tax=Vicia villosa TaxID=3911 RepID=UPI00273CE5CF|nr:uncharacterized protein LOC131622767 [Vicia villosa]